MGENDDNSGDDQSNDERPKPRLKRRVRRAVQNSRVEEGGWGPTLSIRSLQVSFLRSSLI
jgi:hypothetical protein